MRPTLTSAAVAAVLALVSPVASATSAPLPEVPASLNAAEAAGRWRPAEAVRVGIDEIRAAVAGNLALPPDAARLAALGVRIESRLARLVACCTGDNTSARHLRVLFAEMSDGTQLMRGARNPGARRMGLFKVAQALNLYGTMFDHPGWRALDETIEVSAR